MNREQMVELWERHTEYEFALKDANLAVSTMVDDAIVMHLPTMSGGFGKENLQHYYADVFIPGIPADTTSEPVARSVGDSFLVDEFIMRMTHSQDIPFLLPGLAPTDKAVEVPTVVIVKFRGDLMESDRLYWDQAAVLSQLGLIDQSLPFADVTEISGFLRDKVLAPFRRDEEPVMTTTIDTTGHGAITRAREGPAPKLDFQLPDPNSNDL